MTCWRCVIWHVDRERYYYNTLTAEVTGERPATLAESETEAEAAGVAIKCVCGTHRAWREGERECVIAGRREGGRGDAARHALLAA